MKIGVLCIGDELLKGAVINTNLGYMGSKLLQEGIFRQWLWKYRTDPMTWSMP